MGRVAFQAQTIIYGIQINVRAHALLSNYYETIKLAGFNT